MLWLYVSGDNKKDKATNNENLKKEMLEPITKEKSQLDKELKELEVESSGGGKDGGGG